MKAELLAAIEAGDEQTCVGLLKGLDETARRALHSVALRRFCNAPFRLFAFRSMIASPSQLAA